MEHKEGKDTKISFYKHTESVHCSFGFLSVILMISLRKKDAVERKDAPRFTRKMERKGPSLRSTSEQPLEGFRHGHQLIAQQPPGIVPFRNLFDDLQDVRKIFVRERHVSRHPFPGEAVRHAGDVVDPVQALDQAGQGILPDVFKIDVVQIRAG